MSEENTEVTYVGGKAVEQEDTADTTLEVDERQEAMAAVKKAMDEARSKEESDDEDAEPEPKPKPKPKSDDAPERGPDGKFLPKDKGAAKEAADDDEELDLDKASLKQILKAREKVANLKKTATDEISVERRQLEQERQQYQQQVAQLQAQRQQLERERSYIQALKTDPARAIRELGLSPEEYILELAREGTPEGQEARRQKQLDAELAEIRNWRQQMAEQERQRAYQAQVQQIVDYREKSVREFTELALTEDKYPLTATFFKGNEKALVAWGDLAAEEYRTLSGGKEGTYADILDYIEDQLAERSNSWYTKRKPAQKVEQKETVKKPQKARGLSLDPSVSGERRALSPKQLDSLDEEERLQRAREEVARALANSKED